MDQQHVEAREGTGRIYKGFRAPKGPRVMVCHPDPDGEEGPIGIPLWHALYHSPTGMEWGYAGSGPADLALSLLMDALNEEYTTEEWYLHKSLAWRLHQEFHHEITAGLPYNSWTLEQDRIVGWIDTKIPEARSILD